MSNEARPVSDPMGKAEFNELEMQDLTRHLVGQILTIVDATMEDPVRRKAMKDLVVDKIWDSNWKIVQWMKDGGKEEYYPFRTYAYNPDAKTSDSLRTGTGKR